MNPQHPSQTPSQLGLSHRVTGNQPLSVLLPVLALLQLELRSFLSALGTRTRTDEELSSWNLVRIMAVFPWKACTVLGSVEEKSSGIRLGGPGPHLQLHLLHHRMGTLKHHDTLSDSLSHSRELCGGVPRWKGLEERWKHLELQALAKLSSQPSPESLYVHTSQYPSYYSAFTE